MANPRKPRHLHLLNGTYRKDRHAPSLHYVEPMDPNPPQSLEAASIPAWDELVRTCRLYLAQSDRAAVEMASRLLTASRAGKTTAASETLLLRMLDKIGATPEGRSRLQPINAGVPVANPFDELKEP